MAHAFAPPTALPSCPECAMPLLDVDPQPGDACERCGFVLGDDLIILDGPRSRTRLAASPRGVRTRNRFGRRGPLRRWHLFEEVRLTLAGYHESEAGAMHLWRLIIVNAYKPSISTYLHRRGTDEAIFAEAIDFRFCAHPDDARAAAEQMRAWIARARAEYRALRLKDFDLPRAARGLLRLRECPQCAQPMASRGDDALPPCRQCSFRAQPGMFTITGRRAMQFGLSGASALLLMFVSLLLAMHGDGAAAFCFAILSATLGAAWVAPLLSQDERHRRLLIAGDGIHECRRHDVRPLGSWDSIRTLRAAALESGHWRLAGWLDAKDEVIYSPMRQRWLTKPDGPALFDIVLDRSGREGEIICDEILRRFEESQRSRTGR